MTPRTVVPTSTYVATFIAALRTEFQDEADPERALGQQRYLKTTEPCYGVRVPRVRALARAQLKATPPDDRMQWQVLVTALWDGATHREERYSAIEVLLHPRRRAWYGTDLMELAEHMVRTGQWWDLVDSVVHLHNRLRPLDPVGEGARMRQWGTDEDFWIRRFAIICQLQAKDKTDTQLLADVIDANIADREFFIRKAIGWALRDYARTNPEWVLTFTQQRRELLSPLSYREATKHLPEAGPQNKTTG